MIWQPRVPRMFAGDRTRIDHRAEYEWQTRSRLAQESAPVLTRALSPTLHGNDPFSKQLPGSDFSLLAGCFVFSVRRVGRFLPGSLWGPLTNVKLDRLAFLQATKAAYLQHFVSPNQQVVIGTRNVESATLKSLSIQRQAAFETFVLFQPGEQGFVASKLKCPLFVACEVSGC